MSILFVIESPGKIAKISSILGKNYKVVATMGHFRDLDPKKMSIDFDNHFEPIYIITKPNIVKKLRDSMKNTKMVYLAADPDREGSAIAQSVYDVLKPKKYKRILYNAITKQAIMEAIANAGEIDQNLVNAQKARRVIDRLFGYLISPILQKQLGGALSAGRVQSATLRLVVDKEDEIKKFIEETQHTSFFRVSGKLLSQKDNNLELKLEPQNGPNFSGNFSKLKVVLYESLDKNPFDVQKSYQGEIACLPLADDNHPNAKVIIFLKRSLKSEFRVQFVTERMAFRSPPPPFTTSTLQQEANRKLGMSIDTTMRIAQKLYEEGYITYMRTDSVELSPEAHRDIKKVVEKEFGKEYYEKNIYKTKVANAAEAHEAIRPTHVELISLDGVVDDKYRAKLYKLIWQRTIASQMKKAQIRVITIQISISKFLNEKIKPYYYFQSQVEKIVFPGYMKVYFELGRELGETKKMEEHLNDEYLITKDYLQKIPKVGDILTMEEIVARQEYPKPPPRYTEASLVKKMEELGIGRPSTYVSTIKTIMDRDYIRIGSVPGIKKDITTYLIKSKNGKHIMKIFEETETIWLGREDKKLIPTNLGKSVNHFLLENFREMVDYEFTAKMEEELDDISNGRRTWNEVVEIFYNKLKPIVDKMSKKKSLAERTERLLGVDGEGNQIFVVQTKFGPRVKKKVGSKFVYAKLEEPLTLDNIKLDDALKLLKYPKPVGEYDGKDVYLQKGPYGFYLIHGKDRYPIPQNVEEKEINLDLAVEIIKSELSKKIAEFILRDRTGKKIDAVLLKGPYGPYIQIVRGKRKINYPIPKNIDPTNLDEEKIWKIISKKGGSKYKPGNSMAQKRKITKRRKLI